MSDGSYRSQSQRRQRIAVEMKSGMSREEAERFVMEQERAEREEAERARMSQRDVRGKPGAAPSGGWRQVMANLTGRGR